MSEDPPFLFIFPVNNMYVLFAGYSTFAANNFLSIGSGLVIGVFVQGVFFSMYESGSSIKGVYFSFGKIIDYLAVNQVYILFDAFYWYINVILL
ncbi:hypothetical protein HanPI659440_Chr17g0695441 [Helianthus annuus]|nr:hypothetical protein HanPI659440_Chr17g0695441 [Helianthus annuus]